MPIEEEAPKGVCQKCGMVKIQRGVTFICPSCDTQAESQSSLVNSFEDPGHEAMEKILKTEKISELPKVKERVPLTQFGMSEYLGNVTQKYYENILHTKVEFSCILDVIDKVAMPNNMKSIKKLLKVKQLLKELMEETNG